MSVITTTYTSDKQLSANFKLSEFLCKDGTKTVKYSTELVDMLQALIDKCGIIEYGAITSAYRTPDYSVKVGGEKDDAHTVGIAVDIQFKDKVKNIIPQKYVACIAQDLGFGGIGVMKNSIHLDVRHLGGYKNKKWYGDETNGTSLTKKGIDFYKYYGLTKDAVYSYLKVTTVSTLPKTETPKAEPPKVDTEFEVLKKENANLKTEIEKLKSENSNLITVIESTKIENATLKNENSLLKNTLLKIKDTVGSVKL